MLDRLDFMVRYWQLWTRDDADPSAVERAEMMSLLRRIGADQALPAPAPARRGERGLPIRLAAPDRSGTGRDVAFARTFVAGELRGVCSDGVVVIAAALFQPQQRTVVCLADAVSGLEYTLPCVVAWVWHGATSTLGLRIDGRPSRTSFARMPEPSLWRSAASWSEPPGHLSSS